MIRLPRHIIAGVLTVLFLVITISPLFTLAMRSKTIAHAITGECTGDCDTCGCSIERRASHTCCCWQKKLEYLDSHSEKEADCCRKTKKDEPATITSTCPCENGNHLTFWSVEKLHIIQNHFSAEIPILNEDKMPQDAPERLLGRTGEPPVPPPKLFLLS